MNFSNSSNSITHSANETYVKLGSVNDISLSMSSYDSNKSPQDRWRSRVLNRSLIAKGTKAVNSLSSVKEFFDNARIVQQLLYTSVANLERVPTSIPHEDLCYGAWLDFNLCIMHTEII
ncbi:unnamed protein product [Rotaria sordida]|uniref:Uncharacterized protein n=1 Tax=Rotaria sordida TaxID=392033 RepID=A0A815VU18_9BILA|nr:unnamed protein product [Rotaria sordida]CAF1534709.1 unnamed protein product [Rotaria sordida]